VGPLKLGRPGAQYLAAWIAALYAEHDIRANCICPGYFPAPKRVARSFEFFEQIKSSTPIGRLGSPSDLLGLIDFLIDKSGKHINGETFYLDGGVSSMM
ncbi:MAG: SDR family oxidoreductase, partial [Pseudomonadota bacterium]